jgi:hypothetical protein
MQSMLIERRVSIIISVGSWAKVGFASAVEEGVEAVRECS